MKLTTLTLLLTLFIFTNTAEVFGQKKRGEEEPKAAEKAVVVDERLAVLRTEPSLFARPVQRMRRGRDLVIMATRKADGVIFYRVAVPPNNAGWVQAEAVVGAARSGDDVRLARLVQASEGFDRIERAALFVEYFPNSKLRPSILLLFGDLLEEEALRLSQRAARSFDQKEMAASGAPLHSFYLNYSFLDRYRRLGIGFFFNVRTKSYHYNGRVWRELVRKFPATPEATHAAERLRTLEEKLK